jgi:uncharacterized protein YlxW (UPF0749 family)
VNAGMRSRRAQWTLGAVALLLGFLSIVQLRAQASGAGLGNLTVQDLTTLIASLNQENGRLASEVSTLQDQLRTLQAARAQGTSALGGLRDDLDRIRLWAGLDPVTGHGVTVEISGPIAAAAVNDMLNDLRIAGAEALAVNDVRVVPETVVAGPAGALSVENEALPGTFRVAAIGNSINLTAALTRAGGVVSRIQVTTPDVQVVVTPVDSLTLPATERNLVPVYGRPRL